MFVGKNIYAMGMNNIYISLLGTVRCRSATQTVSLTSSSLVSLTTFLSLFATRERTVSRTRAAYMLRPNINETAAHRSLSDSLHRLKKAFGPLRDCIQATAKTIAFVDVRLDIDEFRSNIGMGTLHGWRKAIELYTGDLAEDLDADWLIGERVVLREYYITALRRTCMALVSSGSYPDALEYAYRWTVADPFNEDAHTTAIRLYARLGRYVAALHHYDQLVAMLETELQTTPLPGTRALATSIRTEYYIQHTSPPQPSIIGRHKERLRLLHMLEAAQRGAGTVVVVEGEQGIGKTALLNELAESARWRGVRVVAAKGSDTQPRTPYAPLDLLVRNAVRGPWLDVVCANLAPASAAALRWWLGDTDTVHKERSHGEQYQQNHGQTPPIAQVFGEVLGVLATLGEHLFVLEDVHWSGNSFWQFVECFLPTVADRPIMLAISYRPNRLRKDATAWRLVQQLDSHGVHARIRLNGLAFHDVAQLVRRVHTGMSQETLHLVFQRSGGNPLFLRELLATELHEPLPETLEHVLHARWDMLLPEQRALLEHAAALGEEWTYQQWQAMARADIVAVATALVNHQFLEETDHGYRFRHGVMHEYVYARLPLAQRQELHGRAAQTLRVLLPPDKRAWHHEQAGQWADAIALYGAMAEQAQAAGDHTSARTHLERALELATSYAIAPEQYDELLGALQQATALDRAWHAAHPAPPPLLIELARADVPLGRPVQEHERVLVHWTVDAGAFDQHLLATAGKRALRHHRILRLLHESTQYGAVPTDRELAHALGVTERTISTDLQELHAAGYRIHTRRRT